jgi:uncharacterized protein (TIGR03000 family)
VQHFNTAHFGTAPNHVNNFHAGTAFNHGFGTAHGGTVHAGNWGGRNWAWNGGWNRGWNGGWGWNNGWGWNRGWGWWWPLSWLFWNPGLYGYGYPGWWAAYPYYASYYPYADYDYGYAAPPAGYSGDLGYNNAMPVPQVADASAHLQVIVPVPDAVLWFNGYQASMTGLTRLFDTPPLQPGGDYSYSIKAAWSQNGQVMTAERVVRLTPGANVVIDFTQPAPAPPLPTIAH